MIKIVRGSLVVMLAAIRLPNPNILEIQLVKKWGDIGQERAVGPRIYNKINRWY